MLLFLKYIYGSGFALRTPAGWLSCVSRLQVHERAVKCSSSSTPVNPGQFAGEQMGCENRTIGPASLMASNSSTRRETGSVGDGAVLPRRGQIEAAGRAALDSRQRLSAVISAYTGRAANPLV